MSLVIIMVCLVAQTVPL